jgi:hypothetical protein
MKVAEQIVYVIEGEAQRRRIDQADIGAAMFPGQSTCQKTYSDMVAGKRKLTLSEACLGLEYLGLHLDQVVAEVCALNRRGLEIEPPPARSKGGKRRRQKKVDPIKVATG